MEIIRTNIEENEYSMELMFAMFEDDDRQGLSDIAGTTIDIEKYALYTDENAKGEIVKLISIMDADTGVVYVSSSASFIRAFERILCMSEKCGEDISKIEVVEGKSQKNRRFITAKYVK